MRCLHTEHAKGPASCRDQNGPVKTFCFHFGRVATTRQLIAEIRVSFIEGSAMNRGTMDDKRSGHSCHNLEQLVAQTHHWTTNFLSPETLLKPHSYSRRRSLCGLYVHDFPMLGRSPCTAQGPRQQARVICSPTSWQSRRVPTTMNAPPPHILTSSSPPKTAQI